MKSNTQSALAFAVFALAAVAACKKDPPKKDEPVAAPADASLAPVALAEAKGDPQKGKELVQKFECNRCHDGAGFAAAEQSKNCVHCHADIVDGKFKAEPAAIAKWIPHVKDITVAPSLTSSAKRFKRSWLEAYILEPNDLRVNLPANMPRLAIATEEAKHIAAYLAEEDDHAAGAVEGDVSHGRQLLETKGCGTCHAFTGISPLPASAVPIAQDPKEFAKGRQLAPDLRYARDRMHPAKIKLWLQDPRAMKADTTMPKIPLSEADAADITAYLTKAELAPLAAKPVPARLPVLTRTVSFEEVDKKVFHKTCWHCHSEPDYAIGEGGPGNSGGLGFKPRGLNLSDYNGIAAGLLDDKGERASVFEKDATGTPRLVRALMARYTEEAGGPTGEVRGMPLAYPPLALEDIQLVETWIAQGRPRK